MKNCLLVFRNKKINFFDDVQKVIDSFYLIGYYFDKIAFVAYDSADEIVRASKDAKEYYENIVVYCPASMQSTVKNYFKTLFGSEFSSTNVMTSDRQNIFLLYSDCENALTFDKIKDCLDLKYGIKYDKEFICTVGAPIELINSAIEKAKSICQDIDFNVRNMFGDCRIQLVLKNDIPKAVRENVIRTLIAQLNDYLYAMEDVTLAERVVELLKLRHLKISVAESFTGGGIAKSLVDIAGVSEVYLEGLNTYSNASKHKRLGVRDKTLQLYGAVSEQTAREMAEGLLIGGGCDVCISTTGIAGPKADNTEKPVGLIYIGIGTHENISVYKYNLKGNRETITKTASNLALFLAYKSLK